MLNYLLRRTLLGAMTLLIITFVIFGLIRSIPGTPLTVDLAESDPSRRLREVDRKRLEAAYGLDKPWPVAYVYWLGNLAKGDLGKSLLIKLPVSRLIAERIVPTMLLSVPSIFLMYLIAIPMGLYSTMRSGYTDERCLSVVLFILYSFPSFVAAVLLQVFFVEHMKDTWFELPGFGMQTEGYENFTLSERVWDRFKHLLLPVICYTYGSLAYYSRFVKANMQEVIRQDYIRTARAKGVGPTRVLIHHGFRNSLIPLVTQFGMMLPSFVAGSVILERIFVWPGMGQLLFESLARRDYPIIMGLTLMFSLLTLIGQLLADFLYAVVDPRITYS